MKELTEGKMHPFNNRVCLGFFDGCCYVLNSVVLK